MKPKRQRRIVGSGNLLPAVCLVLLLAAVAAGKAGAQTTELVSVSTSGGDANSDCSYPAISADGSSVAFATYANNIVAGDTNAQMDIFLRTLPTGPTTRVNAARADGFSQHTSISATGRFVAFTSTATNLVSNDTNGKWDIFVHDRDTDRTTRVSVGAGGVQADGSSQFPSISGDGNRVVFQSAAANLTADDTGGKGQIFLRDRTAATTTLVSKSSNGAGNDHSSWASISGNGQYVAFQSRASNLSADDPEPYPDGGEDIYVFSVAGGAVALASVNSGGVKGNGDSGTPSIADNGWVAFYSEATNLAAGATPGQVYVRAGGTTTLVSKTPAGAPGNGVSYDPCISPNGRYIAFTSAATDLVDGDGNGYYDVFVYNTSTQSITRASVSSTGAEGNGSSAEASVSNDGRVAFISGARNLVTPGTWVTTNIFVRNPGVSPEPPLADFRATPDTGAAPLTVSFTDQSTGAVTSWSWDFGDGGISTVRNPFHVYSNPGLYTVTLVVTGPGGTDTQTLTVRARARALPWIAPLLVEE